MKKEEHISQLKAIQEQYEQKISELKDEIEKYKLRENIRKTADCIDEDVYVNAKRTLNKLNKLYMAILWQDKKFCSINAVLHIIELIEKSIKEEIKENYFG